MFFQTSEVQTPISITLSALSSATTCFSLIGRLAHVTPSSSSIPSFRLGLSDIYCDGIFRQEVNCRFSLRMLSVFAGMSTLKGGVSLLIEMKVEMARRLSTDYHHHMHFPCGIA